MDTLTLGLIIGGVLLFVLLCLIGVVVWICCCGGPCDASGFCPGFGGGNTGVAPAGNTIYVQQPYQPPQEPKNDDRWLVLLDDRPRVRTPPLYPAPPIAPPPPPPPMFIPPAPPGNNFGQAPAPFTSIPAAGAPARNPVRVARQQEPVAQYKTTYNYKKDADSSDLIKSNIAVLSPTFLEQMQTNLLFRALEEKHRQQVAEIHRKREDIQKIQAEIKDKMSSLPRQYTAPQSASFTTSNYSNGARHDRVYGPPSATVVRLGSDDGRHVLDMRPQFDQYEKLYHPKPPIIVRMRTPPPTEIRHIDTQKLQENDAVASRYQQSIIDYYKDYNKSVSDQFERNRLIERDRNQDRRTEKSEDPLLPYLKEQLERSRQQSEQYFNRLGGHIMELNRNLDDERRRRREERQELLNKKQEMKVEAENRVTTSTQAQPDRDQASTQVSLVDEARMRSAANRMAFITGVGARPADGVVAGHAVFDMSTGTQPGYTTAGSGIPGVQVINTGGGGEVIIAGAQQPQQKHFQLRSDKNLVTHTHDNPYVQSIIAEIQQELDDIDRERRRLLIKERTEAAEEHLEKMLADLSLEKERLCREIVSLARVNALLTPENGKGGSMDPTSTGAVADVLQLIKDQLRRVCKIQSEANLMRHESVMTHLKTLWSHSDAHTVVEAAPQNPARRIPAPVVPSPIAIDPPSYGLLPALVLFYDFVVGLPNGSLTSIVLNVSVVRRLRGPNGEEAMDMLVDLGELPPAGVSHASRLLDGVQPAGIASIPPEARGVAMVRFKNDIPRQFPADPTIFVMVSLGGQPTAVTNRTSGFARALIPLVRPSDVPDQPATGRYITNFFSDSNLFGAASLFYRLVRLEDAEGELRSWPVSLSRMNLYMPLAAVTTMAQ